MLAISWTSLFMCSSIFKEARLSFPTWWSQGSKRTRANFANVLRSRLGSPKVSFLPHSTGQSTSQACSDSRGGEQWHTKHGNDWQWENNSWVQTVGGCIFCRELKSNIKLMKSWLLFILFSPCASNSKQCNKILFPTGANCSHHSSSLVSP